MKRNWDDYHTFVAGESREKMKRKKMIGFLVPALFVFIVSCDSILMPDYDNPEKPARLVVPLHKIDKIGSTPNGKIIVLGFTTASSGTLLR